MKKILNDNEIDLVHRFLDFELAGSELDSFEHRLKTDDAFKQKVEKYHKAYFLTEFVDESNSVPPNLSRIQTNNISQSEKPKSLKLAIVLVFILGLLALSGYFILKSQNNASNERIYAQVESYVDNMSNSITRGETSGSTSPLELTINKIEDLDDNGINSDELENLLRSTRDADAKEVIYWWLVKIHLKNNDISSAKKTLDIIGNNPNYNSSRKAMEILETL